MAQAEDKKITVLIADDDLTTLRLHAHLVTDLGYEPMLAKDGEDCIKRMAENQAKAVLLDINMPKKDGIEVLEYAKKRYTNLPIIMVTALNDVSIAVKAIKLGAFEYLMKPLDVDRLATVLRNAVSMRDLRYELTDLQGKLRSSELFTNIVGQSNQINEVFGLVSRVLETNVNILIIGESGTGKELVARAIHKGSVLRDGPFIAVNCSAITFEIADSLFFGHKKGSFTGATEDRIGFFEQANGGTIFLDEIGDMDVEIQAKVLRILEEKTVRRVGEKTERAIDFRLIAATNQDLAQSINAKQFRRDLYFRLEEYPIYLPPLRKRREDIPLLAQHFLKEFCEANGMQKRIFSQEAIKKMINHSWPGNIRELKNAVRRSAIRSQEQTISDVLLSYLQDDSQFLQSGEDDISVLDDMERKAISQAYHFTDQNAAEAAKLLGISRATMYRKLKKMGVET
jgi:two-component system response regulator AtoC